MKVGVIWAHGKGGAERQFSKMNYDYMVELSKSLKLIQKDAHVEYNFWMYRAIIYAVILVLLKRIDKHSVVLHVRHGLNNTPVFREIYVQMLGYMIKRLKLTVVYNSYSAQRLHIERGWPEFNSMVKWNILPLLKQGYGAVDLPENFILMVGRNVEEKNFIRACKAITNVGFNGVVVGSGTERLSMYPNIVTHRYTENLYAFYEKCRAVLIPSFTESLSNVLLEAVSMDKTIFVTDCGDSWLYLKSINYTKWHKIEGFSEKAIVESLMNEIL